jgi:Xaa-Pro dipeptidase
MQDIVPSTELQDRMDRFMAVMDKKHSDWQLAAIFGRINQYYFTGTMQDGVLLIPREGEAVFWVRRSIERAKQESNFPSILPMKTFRDAAKGMDFFPESVFLEAEIVPIALLERFRKHFPFRKIQPVDSAISGLRAVKSAYEMALLERAGDIHRRVLEDLVPDILYEGMSEAEFGCAVYSQMVREGHQGIVRFGMFGVEIEVGHLGFGESSICPTAFDGTSGIRGIGPAAPVLGSRDRRLCAGDLVFIDNACGVGGYQTDKTMNYMFKKTLPKDVIDIHSECVEILHRAASLLKPGIAPSDIYNTIMDGLSPEFRENFMGSGHHRVQFIGHGVGLHVDEPPVIAAGFDEPLQEGMVIAIEPKSGLPGIGMVGIENTFAVTPQGGRSLTGDSPGLIPVW